MTILSYQTIKALSVFDPCHERTVHSGSGMTYGLGPAGYDVRLAEDVILPPGAFALASILEHMSLPDDVLATVHDKSTLARMGLTAQTTVAEPGWKGFLTVELSNNHPAWVPSLEDILESQVDSLLPFRSARKKMIAARDRMAIDRDTYTKAFSITLRAGQPIAQIVCHRLDERSDQPYQGKYQNQPAMPVPAIFEGRR